MKTRDTGILNAAGKMITATVPSVVAVAIEVGTASTKLAEAVRSLFAGVPAAKRDTLRKELYSALVAKAGVDASTKKAYSIRDLKAANPTVYSAYMAVKMAYSRLFPSVKTKAKRKTAAKAIVIPFTPKGVAAMAKAAIGAIQKMETPKFDAARAVAAWQALADVFTAKK